MTIKELLKMIFTKYNVDIEDMEQLTDAVDNMEVSDNTQIIEELEALKVQHGELVEKFKTRFLDALDENNKAPTEPTKKDEEVEEVKEYTMDELFKEEE